MIWGLYAIADPEVVSTYANVYDVKKVYYKKRNEELLGELVLMNLALHKQCQNLYQTYLVDTVGRNDAEVGSLFDKGSDSALVQDWKIVEKLLRQYCDLSRQEAVFNIFVAKSIGVVSGEMVDSSNQDICHVFATGGPQREIDLDILDDSILNNISNVLRTVDFFREKNARLNDSISFALFGHPPKGKTMKDQLKLRDVSDALVCSQSHTVCRLEYLLNRLSVALVGITGLYSERLNRQLELLRGVDGFDVITCTKIKADFEENKRCKSFLLLSKSILEKTETEYMRPCVEERNDDRKKYIEFMSGLSTNRTNKLEEE